MRRSAGAAAIPAIAAAGCSTQAPATRRRRDLDLVRGVAILLALGWHFNGRDSGLLLVDMLQQPGRAIGWAGVDLFFVLSGFLIGTLIFQEYARTGKFQALRFLLRRAFKIWPVLYAYIALLVLSGRYHWSQVVPQTLFHVQNYFTTPVAHLWSLAVEEHFYLAFAALFCLFQKAGRRDLRIVPACLLALMVIAPLLRACGQLAGVSSQALQWQTQFRVDALACGVGLAWLRQFDSSRFHSAVGRKGWLAAAVAAGIFVLLEIRSSPALISTLGYSISYLTGGAFLLWVYDLPDVLERSVPVRLMAWLGTYSYALYVFQFVMFRAGELVWLRTRPGTNIPPLVELSMRYVGAIVIAVLFTKVLERPLLVVRDRILPHRAAL